LSTSIANYLAVECKWSARDFDPAHLLTFGRTYPKFELVVVAGDAQPEFTRQYNGITVRFLNLAGLAAKFENQVAAAS